MEFLTHKVKKKKKKVCLTNFRQKVKCYAFFFFLENEQCETREFFFIVFLDSFFFFFFPLSCPIFNIFSWQLHTHKQKKKPKIRLSA